MIRTLAAFAVALAVACFTPLGAGTATAATGDPVSTIRSAATKTCWDVSLTDPANYFLDTYAGPCTASTSQRFKLHRLFTGPADTYEIVSVATGQCMDQCRFGIRQEACAGSVPPDQTNAEWTLEPVGTTGRRYRIETMTTVGSGSPQCIQAGSRPPGYPGNVLTHTTCNPRAANQVFILGTAP